MSEKEPNIRIPVDLTNPGQYFACCGLLELADRLWPGAEGFFDSQHFFMRVPEVDRPLHQLCHAIIACSLSPVILAQQKDGFQQLVQSGKESKSLNKLDQARKKQLESEQRVAGFELGVPFSLRINWWQDEIPCDADHLKTWSGRQVIGSVAAAIKSALCLPKVDGLLDIEKVVFRKSDGKPVAPLNFDAGRVGTAQDIGYSPDSVNQPIACCVWTEFLTLIALQRFALKPDQHGFFSYHVWRELLPACVAAIAARGSFPDMIGCTGRFRLITRGGKGYTAFQQATLTDWRQ